MDSNDELVDYLKTKGQIETERVEDAFRTVDRRDFVPRQQKEDAYRDRPLPIAEESTISAPHMVAKNTELLEVGSNDTVLEIGSGSGYQLAVLAELTGEEVVGVERIEELAEESRESLELWENTRIIHGNGLDAVERKFDRILFSCGIDSFELGKEYLERKGLMVAPVNAGSGQVLQSYDAGIQKIENHGRVRFAQYRDKPI